MARWGSCNFKSFDKLTKDFDKAVKERLGERMIINILYEVANRGLAKTKRRTPVGVYDGNVNFTTKQGKKVVFARKSTKVGGTLRRGWYITKVSKKGQKYYIEIYNNTEYASFVEYGHRTKNNKGWVDGKFMLTISMKEVEMLLPKIVDQHTQKTLLKLLEG